MYRDDEELTAEAEDAASRRPGGVLVRLLVPSTPCLFGLLAFAAVCFLPHPGRTLSLDTFLHVELGEHMLRQGALVTTDPTTWAVDRPYLDHEWLPQLVFGACHLVFGLEGLVLATALGVGATFALLAAWMRRRGVTPLVAAGLLAAAFAALRLFMLARPFLWSWVLAVVWTMLLERLIRRELAPRTWLAAAVALMWLWANLHAGFLLGFVLLGIFGLAQIWRLATAADRERQAELRLLLWMVGGGQLAFFASALNPYGFRLHAHFLVYLTRSELLNRIVEWQAPFFHAPAFFPALLLLGFLLALWLAAPRRLRPAELLLVLALLLAALRSQRNLPLFVLLTLPAAAVSLEAILAHLAAAGGWLGGAARRLRQLSRWAAAAERRRGGLLTAAVVVAAIAGSVGAGKVHPAELDGRRFPLAAARFVAERPELFGGPMYNFYNWGGYLAWKLEGHRVFINGLQDHYGAAHYGRYAAVEALRPGWREILDEAGVDWVIYPAQSPLTAGLDLDPGWRRVYGDPRAEIFVRDDGGDPVPAWAARRAGELANVLVLVLDTTRADAVGTATPALDRLARDGTRFTAARSTSAWTLPAHGSLFTGLYPSRHGAHWEHQLLGWEATTLAELLAPTHRTAGWSENPHITRAKGFAQGFEEFAETWRPDAVPTLEGVERWIAEDTADRPFFLFVNLMTPHLPYQPPAEHQERFLAAADATAEEVERLRRFGEREARLYMSGALELTESQLEILRALYRADVAFADAQAARILGWLETAGELDDTLVVVVGDHGENLGDHGLMEHQLCLYETVLRVPMILRLPGVVAAGRVEAAPVQLVDVVPTVLEAVGVPYDRWPPVEGRSLLGQVPPERPVVAEYMLPAEQERLFGEVSPGFDFSPFDRRLRSIQVGAMKLIVPDRGPLELYDLAADPGESRNLADSEPQTAAALRRQLEAWVGGRKAALGGGEPVLDEETRDALRSLGYLD